MKLFIAILFLLPLPAVADTFSYNDITLDYEIQGTGPALILLHGGMGSRDDLRLQITALAKTHKVIALDSREQGRSSTSDTQISYDLMAQDVLALADHLNLQKFSLMGQSDGGITALKVAITAPARIKKLILLGALYNHSVMPDETKEYLLNYSWQPDMQNEGFAALFTSEWLKHHSSMDGFNHRLQEMIKMWTSSPNLTEADLQKIAAKTLIINGDHEDVDLEHVVSMHGAIKNAQLFIVPGATHFLHQEKPELLNQVVLDFLSSN